MKVNKLILEIADKKGFEIKRSLGGMLNENYMIYFNNQNYVFRIPIKNLRHKKSIEREYKGIGYYVNGNEYNYRSIEEQVIFSNLCSQKGISVARIIDYSSE